MHNGQFNFQHTDINSVCVINADATLKLMLFISCMYCSKVMVRKFYHWSDFTVEFFYSPL